MRFDTARAVEWAGTFAFPRAAGTDGERKAAAIAAEELARLGLRVERLRSKALGCRAGRALAGLAGRGRWATGLAWAAHRGAHWPVRLALALGALLWLRLTAVEGFLLGRALLRRVATTNVVAWREGKGEPPPLRVVFHTTLDTFDARRELVPPWLTTRVIGGLLAALIFCEMTINRNPLGLPSGCWFGSGPLFLLLLWLAIAHADRTTCRRTGRPDARDNRTGLAVLLELARGWPRGTDSRIESRFVATGGRTLDRAGLRAWSTRSAPSGPPGRRSSSTGSRRDWPGTRASGAGDRNARRDGRPDLWIPHRVIHRTRSAASTGPLPPRARLHRHGRRRRRRAPGPVVSAIEPEALGRAAQLATEVALRWARRKQPGGETRSLDCEVHNRRATSNLAAPYRTEPTSRGVANLDAPCELAERCLRRRSDIATV